MRTVTVVFCLAVLAMLAGPEAALAAGDPVAVSPGGRAHAARIATSCPTFSWGSVEGARAYEVSIFVSRETDSRGKRRLSQPRPEDLVRRVAIEAAATSWTPEGDECLHAGGSYAWTVQEIDEEGNRIGGPSRPRTFRIDPRGDARQSPETSGAEAYRSGSAAAPDYGDDLDEDEVSGAPAAAGLDVIQARRTNRMRLEDIEAKVDDILAQVTPGKLNSSASVCFAIPSAALQLESGFGNELNIEPRVGLGVNLWGNKAEANAKMSSKGAAAFKVAGGIGATFQICLEGPGRTLVASALAARLGGRMVGAGPADAATIAALEPLADAMAAAVDIVANEVADHGDQLGFDPSQVAAKAQKAIDLWKGIQFPSNPFEILDPNSDIRTRLKETSDLLPIPDGIKEKIQHPEDLLPDSLDEVNVCDPAFKYPLPAGKIKDLVDDMCGFADRAMMAGGVALPGNVQEVADNAVDKIEALSNLKDQLLGALDAVIRMEESISASLSGFEATFPNKIPTLFNPPSPPKPKGGHPLCSLRVPPPGCLN